MNEEIQKDLTLDPKDWEAMRQLGHQMIDDLINYWAGIREEKNLETHSDRGEGVFRPTHP